MQLNNIQPLFAEDRQERIHGSKSKGKITRLGFFSETQEKSMSIPTKLTTTLFRKEPKTKAFGYSVERFDHSVSTSYTPGPGTYSVNSSTLKQDSTSFSRSGYGNGFVSKEQRSSFEPRINKGPGPGWYRAKNMEELSTSHSYTNVFNNTCSRITETKASTDSNMGPGKYNPEKNLTTEGLLKHKQFRAPFVSRVGRNIIRVKKTPGPGEYTVLGKTRNDLSKNPSAPAFAKSVVKETTKLGDLAKMREKIGIPLERKNEEYSPREASNKVRDEEFQKLFVFRVDSHDRFGSPLKENPHLEDKKRAHLGPGYYNPSTATGGFSDEKFLKSGSVFVSETEKGVIQIQDEENKIGPARYNPKLPAVHENHHNNLRGVWI